MNILVVHYWDTHKRSRAGWMYNHHIVAHNVELMHQLLPIENRISHRMSINIVEPLSEFPEMSHLIKWLLETRRARSFISQDAQFAIAPGIDQYDIVFGLPQNRILRNSTGENFFSVMIDLFSRNRNTRNEKLAWYRQDSYDYIGHTVNFPLRNNAAPNGALFKASEWHTACGPREELDMEPCLYLKPCKDFSITSYSLERLTGTQVKEML